MRTDLMGAQAVGRPVPTERDVAAEALFRRWAAVLAATFLAAYIVDEVMAGSGATPAMCQSPPSEFWGMFERCSAWGGEHLFHVAAVAALVGTVAYLFTGAGRVARGRVRDAAIAAMLVGETAIVLALLGMEPVIRDRTIFMTLAAGILLTSAGALAMVPERFRPWGLVVPVYVFLIALVSSTGFLTERFVS